MKYLKIWTSFRDVLEPLADDEKGRLFVLMLNYAEDGADPGKIAGNERYTWPSAKQAIDLMKAENERLKKNGQNGGRPPKNKDPEETNENQEKPTETNENQPEPTKSQKEKKYKEIERKEIIDTLFDRFWTAYPRKVAKPDARKKFEKLNPDEALLETMLAAIEKQKRSDQWIRDGGQFIPHPSTWLNQRRWEDEVTETRAPAARVTAHGYTQRDYAGEQEDALVRMLKGVGA